MGRNPRCLVRGRRWYSRGLRYLLLTLLVVLGCGGGDSGRPDAMIFGEQCEPGGSFDITGRVGVLAVLNVHVNASGLVETDTTAELLLAMDVVQSGVDVEVIAELCTIDIPDVPIAGQDKPIQFDVPVDTISSVGTVLGAASLSSANETCASFDSQQFTIIMGAILDPVATALLPQADEAGDFSFCAPTADTSCALAIGVNCACDQEGDGKAGMTLIASNVPAVNLDEVYATLRTQFSLRGEVHSSDLIIGEIDAAMEQGIIGCHLAAGNDCNPDQIGAVKNLNPAITQQPGNASRFRSVRIDSGTPCSFIIDNKDELFPR